MIAVEAADEIGAAMKRLGSRGEFAVLAIIMLVAVFFRTFRLDTVPGGLTDDEATWGVRASRVANGEIHPILFDDERPGPEPIYGYLVAVLFKLFGPSILVARTLTALVAIGTLPVFYLLLKELFPGRIGQGSLPVIALVATSWLATSYWHVVYSRYVIEPILLPLVSVSVFYFLWRGINSHRLWCFACSGFLLGVGVYTYQAGRVLPFFVLVYLIYLAWRDQWSVRTSGFKIALVLGTCFIVVAPLAASAVHHPEAFLSRASVAFFFNSELNEGSPIRGLATGVSKAATMFNLEGDPAPERNPGRRPILDALTSLFFLTGLIIAVARTRERAYAFVWMWFVVMCLPAALTILEIPNFSRAIGALPALYIPPAIAVVEAYGFIKSRTTSTRVRAVSASFLFGVPILFAAATTYRDYFGAWAEREDLHRQFDVTFIEAANVMNQIDVARAVWIWPTTSLVSGQHVFSHPDFLYHGGAPYHYLSCDDRTGANELIRMCQEATTALVFEWKEYVPEKAYEAMAADPKGLISFLLHKYGRELDRNAYEAFDIVTYQLPEPPVFSIADSFEPLTVNFGDELMLAGMAFGGSSLQDTSTEEEVVRRILPSGKSAWVVLRWRALSVPSRNYAVSVYLEDEGAHIAGQIDKLLLSNLLHPTQDWEAGQEEIDYYSLPSWSGTAPGSYKVGLTVYDAHTLETLGVIGAGQTNELGMMEIVRPLMAGDVQPEVKIEPSAGRVAPGIRLLGYDLPRRELNPGDRLSVALYWQALEDVTQNYLLALQLTDEQGQVWAETSDPPVYGTYATTRWVQKETLKDWHDLSLPAETPQGSYQVSVLISKDDNLVHEESLDVVDIRGRVRQFVVPQIQHLQEAGLGEVVQFLGYDLSSSGVSPVGTLQLTLYWQALQEMQVSHTVFIHLLDLEGRIWGQTDSVPGRGEAPTTSWVQGEVLRDEYEIIVHSEAPPGEYLIQIGMYDAITGQRLLAHGPQGESWGDRILLQATPVVVVQTTH